MDKTNVNTNWQRLASVIRWSGMTINRFAHHIGLSRAENLYQIKNGNNGISQNLARRIVEAFPAVSIGWLLTGEGAMFCDEQNAGAMPCFWQLGRFAAYARGEKVAADCIISFPMVDADVAFAVRFGEDDALNVQMGNAESVKKTLFLKKIDVCDIIPAWFYVILTSNFIYLRKIKALSSCEGKLTFENTDAMEWSIPSADAAGDAVAEWSHREQIKPCEGFAVEEIEAVYRVVGVYHTME